jgi:hypothetical protein
MTFQLPINERKTPMDVKHIDRAIGYGFIIIAGYYVVGVFIPLLIWAELGLVAFRIYLVQRSRKK